MSIMDINLLSKIFIGIVVFHMLIKESNKKKNSKNGDRELSGQELLLRHANTGRTLYDAFDPDALDRFTDPNIPQNPMYDEYYNARTDRNNDYAIIAYTPQDYGLTPLEPGTLPADRHPGMPTEHGYLYP